MGGKDRSGYEFRSFAIHCFFCTNVPMDENVEFDVKFDAGVESDGNRVEVVRILIWYGRGVSTKPIDLSIQLVIVPIV